MALTVTQRRKLLTRVILKASHGELPLDTLVNNIVNAVGGNLDRDLETERVPWCAALNEHKANAAAQIAAIDTELLDIG